jgi:23S rRNA (cytosine1962-C5)-methyltransferase
VSDAPVDDADDQPPWSRRPAVRVSKDAQRQIRGGHPWVFDRSIVSIKPGGRSGDLAVVFDDNRRFLALGLYDPDSPLRIRILHRGRPQTIDGDWLAAAIARAVDRRRPLLGSPSEDGAGGQDPLDRPGSNRTDACRLVHGENDGLPGLVVDKYADNLVVKLYTSAWLPWLKHLVAAILSGTGDAFAPAEQAQRVVLRLSRHVATEAEASASIGPSGSMIGDGVVVHGPILEANVEFVENGLTFEADLLHGHKTGHFLDQRDNRRLVGELSAGQSVLDVFACSGGFSVNAAAGGAVSVTSVDRSDPALELARSNMQRNGDRTGHCHHRTITGDAFAVMDDLIEQGRRFDVVVVDPPAFAQRKSQAGRAIGAYRRLANLGAQLTEPDGLLFQASCSSRVSETELCEAVAVGIAKAGRVGTELRRTGQPLDHPVGFAQGRYLKAVVNRLDRGRGSMNR